jgi:arylsulfatase
VSALNGKAVNRGALFWEHEGNRAVRLENWKMVAGAGERWQLYDIATDRAEMHNVAAGHPEKVTELTTLYHAWAARCGVEPWPIRR